MFEKLLIENRFSVFAIENRNRDTPKSLTGDAPIITIGKHVFEADLAPGRNILDLVGFLQKLLFDLADRAEPLISSTEDRRLLCSPIMRISVDDIFGFDKIAVLFQ